MTPNNKKEDILQSLYVSHAGITQTMRMAQQLYYWPGMAEDIKKMINMCKPCQTTTSPTKKPTEANTGSKHSTNAKRGHRFIFNRQRISPSSSRSIFGIRRKQTPQQHQHHRHNQPTQDLIRTAWMAPNNQIKRRATISNRFRPVLQQAQHKAHHRTTHKPTVWRNA